MRIGRASNRLGMRATVNRWLVVAKILHGVKPGDIPVDYSVRFRLVVNLQTPNALRLQIPQSVLIQADEVIR
jgi:ABC-type uncharacterized transport system substrate-binding protein